MSINSTNMNFKNTVELKQQVIRPNDEKQTLEENVIKNDLWGDDSEEKNGSMFKKLPETLSPAYENSVLDIGDEMPEMRTLPHIPGFDQVPEMKTLPHIPGFDQVPEMKTLPQHIPGVNQTPQLEMTSNLSDFKFSIDNES